MTEIGKINNFIINNLGTPLPARVGIKGEPKPAHIPDGILIRQKVAREYGIHILDSDVKFTGYEVAAIAATLEEIKKKKKQHLIGVRQIVKNQEYRIRLINAALIHAGGAYDAENKRVYLFDSLTPKEIPEVLVHEIGHAVSHFNLEFRKFMEFVKESGYNMAEFRKFFIPGNKYHQIGLKKVDIPTGEWEKVMDRFSMKSLVKSQDVFGEIVLERKRIKKHPWDENPLERFAWAYEWYLDRPEAFERLAKKDSTWQADLDFLKEQVFEENAS